MATSSSASYYNDEIHRFITEVFDFLTETKEIGMREFTQLINIVGAGHSTRLRLTYDRRLPSRLSHLYNVCNIALGNKTIIENQTILNVENINPAYQFDCDLILEDGNTGVIYLVDVTSSEDFDTLNEKDRRLSQKLHDPSLSGKKCDYLIAQEQSVGFRVIIETITEEPNTKMPASYTMRLIENILKKSDSYRKEFFSRCNEITDELNSYIMQKDLDTKLYNSSSYPEQKINDAIEAVSSNNMDSNIKVIAGATKKSLSPYVDILRQITAQSTFIRKPFIHPEAKLSSERLDFEDTLSRLRDDPIARCIRAACDNDQRIAALKQNEEIEYIDKFPIDGKNAKALKYNSGYKLCVKRMKGHYFKMYFSYDFMDNNLRRILFNETSPSERVEKGKKASIENVINKIREEEESLGRIKTDINRRILTESHSTIWDKVITICQSSKHDIGNPGRVGSNLLASTAFSLSHIRGGAIISHIYEIVKTFCAAIKNSQKGQVFYVGTNGAYESITITKMNATQDSFKRSHYMVISRKDKNEASLDNFRSIESVTKTTIRSSFRTLDHNEIAYFLRLPYIVLSLITWDVESNISKGKLNTRSLPDIFTSSILHSLVNRDTFAQASQQVRYLYSSSIGFGSDPTKIAEKIDFLVPRSTWEFIYVYRMIKMSICLAIIRDSDRLSDINVDGELLVAFPHSKNPCKSFSQTISSMYYCNIFNKFRAFHEVSEAFCYNELDEEDDIYQKSIKENPDFVSGLSRITWGLIDNYDYLRSSDFVKAEVEFGKRLIDSGIGRFKGSVPYIVSCSHELLGINESVINDVFSELGKPPIEAVTMRGSMEHGRSTDRNQGIRAASAIFEELMRVYDTEPDKLNNNTFLSYVFQDTIEKSGGDSSIYSFVCNQLGDATISYIYRIVQKDQVGNREISVLNAVFRLGALFVETISRTLSNQIKDVDLLENPDKDYVYEQAVKRTTSKNGTVCYDNSDQKRWGPNHLLSFFSAMFLGVLHQERGLMRLILFVSQQVLHKRAKFPESLINLFYKQTRGKKAHNTIGLTREGISKDHGSETLKTFYANHASDLFAAKYDKELAYGMCQGIFHSTSSVYHAIMCKNIEKLVHIKFGKSVIIKSFCTSDDSSRIIVIHNDHNRLNVIKQIHNYINRVGILFNIIRNNSKSTFSFHIAEFNSIFFRQGQMATPSLKQRIAKIDVGAGSNHVEDYLTALSSASNYFSVGGSYVGAVILSILNITLHTEQWNRWDFTSAENYYKPVEFGGFPVIEPISTCLSGAISNVYLRSANIISSDNYASLFSKIITDTPEQFTLADYQRVPKALSDVASQISVYKNSGALGIFSLLRTDRKLSQFENRHKMSLWNFPDHFVSLKRDSPDSRFFLYNIYKNGCLSLFAENEGVNSFYKRFSDPWVSRDRNCVKISKRSILTTLDFDPEIRVSYNDVNKALLSLSAAESSSNLVKFSNSLDRSDLSSNLIDQLVPRLTDAKSIQDFLCSQECSDYIEPRHTPATSRVTLRGHQALDREEYVATIIKVLAGEKARYTISDLYNDHRKFDSLPSSSDCPDIPLKDAVLLAENSTHAFEKFIKRNTKLITSGAPTSMSNLVTMVLKSRFFEGVGVRLIGSLHVVGDRSLAFSYTNWYKELSERSENYVREVANKSLKQTYADVVKFGIRSDKNMITPRSLFTIDDVNPNNPNLKIIATSRSSLISMAKSWIGANIKCSFAYESLNKFYSGNLLNRSEYKISANSFSRPAQGLYFDISVNGLRCVHIITTLTRGESDSYHHLFLTESNSHLVYPTSSLTQMGASRSWAANVQRFITSNQPLFLNRTYHVNQDTVTFMNLDISTTFDLEIPDETITIVARAHGFTFPICHVDPKGISGLSLGYKLNHNDIIEAVTKYHEVLQDTNDLKDDNKLRFYNPALKYLLYRVTPSTPLRQINDTLYRLNHQRSNFHSFSNLASVDIFRTLLLDDKMSVKTVSTSRLYQYVNNLFKSPSSRENYILSVNIEDTLQVSDNDVSAESMIEDELSLDDIEFDQLPLDDNNSDSESVSNTSKFDFVDDLISEPDFDFDAAEEGETYDETEGLFEALNLTKDSSEEDTRSILSSRTGITVNPSGEFPHTILSKLQLWDANNKPKSVIGLASDVTSVCDLPRLYLGIMQLNLHPGVGIFQRMFETNEIELPCNLSDLTIIKGVLI